MRPPATTFSLVWKNPGSPFFIMKSIILPILLWWRGSLVIRIASGRSLTVVANCLSKPSVLRTATEMSFSPRAGAATRNSSSMAPLDELRVAAPALGLKLISVAVRSTDGFDRQFATTVSERPDAILMTNDPLHQSNIGRIIDFMMKNGLPGFFQTRENVVAGGLMSYGASFPNLFRQGASYVHKILQGAKPEDLPVQQ